MHGAFHDYFRSHKRCTEDSAYAQEEHSPGYDFLQASIRVEIAEPREKSVSRNVLMVEAVIPLVVVRKDSPNRFRWMLNLKKEKGNQTKKNIESSEDVKLIKMLRRSH